MSETYYYGPFLAFLLSLGRLFSGQPDEEHLLPGEPSARERHFQNCARVCAECMNRCEENYRHCAELLAAGKKAHLRSMQLSLDCADLCATAGRLSARYSPVAAEACAACAKACDACAAECDKHGDAHMKNCAKVCRDCAKTCRDMVKHVAQSHR